MLTRLEIKNFAVIAHAVFEPGSGLNVITGETGAGKSLLIDALGLIMGDKASRNIIRSDADHAFVEAIFDVSDNNDPEFLSFMDEFDIAPEDGNIIVSRKVGTDGKSTARINNKTVVLAVLRQLSRYLVDIHGQNDTQVIFDENKNCELLFRYCGSQTDELRKAYQSKLDEYKDLVLKIRNLSQSPEMLRKRKEYLEYALEEIDGEDLKPGIDDELLQTKRKIAESSEIAGALSAVKGAFDDEGSDRGVVSLISASSAGISRLDNKDAREISGRLESLLLDAQSIKEDVDKLIDELDFDPGYKDEIDRRLSRIFDLKSRYGATIEDILKFRDDAKVELASFEDNKEVLAGYKKKRHELESELLESAKALSEKLFEKSRELEKSIISELSDLEMPDSIFSVEFTERPKDRYFSSHGIYDIRFMFSANPGQAAKPLSSIVSGGEASRIMLAIKNILSKCDEIPTLIFDEIDMGVSGKASVAIASKLSSIASDHQVLCVSHTSQICAAADHNYLLSKSRIEDNTVSVVSELSPDEKVKEVSRLLSGNDDDRSVELAKALIDQFRG
ncbi:MAG: DNA repair protein RecN [Clostridiales bacterium]|nr:DNA repair protein RecN [Clostridiales bacterium]